MPRIIVGLMLGWFALGPWSETARADGGSVRVQERKGNYQITVFTSPTPLQAGLIDVSVLVQDAATGTPNQDARVTIHATPRGRQDGSIACYATTEAATNKLFYSAKFQLPSAGAWDVEVLVETAEEKAQVRFELEAGEAAPAWFDLWPWLAWPFVAIALFGVHQVLARRRR